MVEVTSGKSFGSVGRCIYCNRSEPEVSLSKEHIIPFGLGGNLTLDKASCDECSHITGTKIEQPVLKKILGNIRIVQGFPTRNKKDRPAHLSAEIKVGSKWKPIQVPVKYSPYIAPLYSYNPPAILRGLTPMEAQQEQLPGLWGSMRLTEDGREWIKKKYPGATEVRTGASFNHLLFQRMLAKIAHSFTVAEKGLNSFNAFLPKGILGRETWPLNYYVGGEPNPVDPEEHKYEIGFRSLQSVDQRPYLTVRIRLLCEYGGPVYFVVVGLPPYANPTSS
ncbi:MAG: HNH endonuclease [Proteobacteria bacterium]|nr:HNH endonuclease [Pseudomonadota bacterium]